MGTRSLVLARAVHFALPETRAGGLEGGEQVVMRKGFVSRITSPSQDSLHMAGPFALVLDVWAVGCAGALVWLLLS